MKRFVGFLVVASFASIIASVPGKAADLSQVVSALKQGGHVIVIRHTATDESQKDIYPFDFANMSAQRQLSEKGREAARQLGSAIKSLGIPVGDIYTSKLNRAVETGKLLSGKEVIPSNALTDSGAGSASAMAAPGSGNLALGRALRDLANAAPKPGTNTILVTHKTNIADAFGKDFGDVQEGEAMIYKPASGGAAVLVARVKAGDWASVTPK
jgi:broad specificity phosphatase PhoE